MGLLRGVGLWRHLALPFTGVLKATIDLKMPRRLYWLHHCLEAWVLLDDGTKKPTGIASGRASEAATAQIRRLALPEHDSALKELEKAVLDKLTAETLGHTDPEGPPPSSV
jgi:hypothetical protein